MLSRPHFYLSRKRVGNWMLNVWSFVLKKMIVKNWDEFGTTTVCKQKGKFSSFFPTSNFFRGRDRFRVLCTVPILLLEAVSGWHLRKMRAQVGPGSSQIVPIRVVWSVLTLPIKYITKLGIWKQRVGTREVEKACLFKRQEAGCCFKTKIWVLFQQSSYCTWKVK